MPKRIKALVKKARALKLFKKGEENKETKMLLGLLKRLSHCPSEKRADFYSEIEATFKNSGSGFEKFLAYFLKNWLKNNFLEGLFEAYKSNSNITFVRTNNPCELFNKYLGIKKIII